MNIQTIQNIKKGSKITFTNGIYTILLGLFIIIFKNWILEEDFRSIQSVWRLFTKYNPEITSLFYKLVVLQGIFVISIGITIIYLSYLIRKKKEKSTWVFLFIIGLIFWAGYLTISIFNKNFWLIVLSFIGWISFIIGMILPIKYYIQKSYMEY